VIVKSWTAKQRFSHHGKYWNFEDIIVEPPTAQKPHPPIWMGAGSPDSIRQVAARGYNLLLDQFASFEAVAERIGIFKAEMEKRGRAFDPLDVGVARAFHVAKDPADKEAALEGCAGFLELHRQHWPGWEGEIEMRAIVHEDQRPSCTQK